MNYFLFSIYLSGNWYREASEGQAHRAESSTASTSPRSSTSDYSRSKSSPRLRSSETFSTQESDDPSAEQTPARDLNIEDSNNQATAIAGSSAESISEIVGAQVEAAAVHLIQEIEEDRETSALDGSVRANFCFLLRNKYRSKLVSLGKVKKLRAKLEVIRYIVVFRVPHILTCSEFIHRIIQTVNSVQSKLASNKGI
jgi:hypothetical protein